MQYIRIVEWEKYQHYKDRDPPWIKLHKRMLRSRTWVRSNDATKLLAIALMMVASDTGNKTEADPEYVRDVCHLQQTPDFGPLIALGFIEYIDENGAALASCEHSLPKCSTEKRREEAYREEKKEAPQSAAAPRRNDRGARLALDWKATDEQRQFARDCGLDPDRTETIFRNFWHAKSGKDACKLDWGKTWQNWCLRDAKPSATSKPPVDSSEVQKTRIERIAWQIGRGIVNNLDATPAEISSLVQAGRITEDQARRAGWAA